MSKTRTISRRAHERALSLLHSSLMAQRANIVAAGETVMEDLHRHLGEVTRRLHEVPPRDKLDALLREFGTHQALLLGLQKAARNPTDGTNRGVAAGTWGRAADLLAMLLNSCSPSPNGASPLTDHALSDAIKKDLAEAARSQRKGIIK